MDKTRIRVDIMGRGFNLVSGENTDYLLRVAKEVDKRMRDLKNENPKLMYDTAAVLTSLNLCDELFEVISENERKKKNSKEEDENIRSQLVEYSKELSKATSTIKKLERELDKIKRESREQQERVKKEYEAKEKEILDMLDSM